jgi:hypothetical protein
MTPAIFAWLGLGFFAIMLGLHAKIDTSEGWTAISGRIVTSRVVSYEEKSYGNIWSANRPSGPSYSYTSSLWHHADLLYQYEIRGQRYANKRVAVTVETTKSRQLSQVERFLRPYGTGHPLMTSLARTLAPCLLGSLLLHKPGLGPTPRRMRQRPSNVSRFCRGS